MKGCLQWNHVKSCLQLDLNPYCLKFHLLHVKPKHTKQLCSLKIPWSLVAMMYNFEILKRAITLSILKFAH